MASLYQSGSSSRTPPTAPSRRARPFSLITSRKVLEVLLPAGPPPEPQDVGRQRVRAQLDVVPRAIPQVAARAQQVVYLVGLRRLDAQRVEWQVDPARLRVMRVQVNHRQDQVVAVGAFLRVGDELVVVHRHEPQARVEVQRRVLAADAIHPRYEVPQAVLALQIAPLDLVLLRVELLLLAE